MMCETFSQIHGGIRRWRRDPSSQKSARTFVADSRMVNIESIGLSLIIRAIKNLQIVPYMKMMPHKIINNALHVGKVAHDYLVKCK